MTFFFACFHLQQSIGNRAGQTISNLSTETKKLRQIVETPLNLLGGDIIQLSHATLTVSGEIASQQNQNDSQMAALDIVATNAKLLSEEILPGWSGLPRKDRSSVFNSILSSTEAASFGVTSDPIASQARTSFLASSDEPIGMFSFLHSSYRLVKSIVESRKNLVHVLLANKS